jgi:hypothetical protein
MDLLIEGPEKAAAFVALPSVSRVFMVPGHGWRATLPGRDDNRIEQRLR